MSEKKITFLTYAESQVGLGHWFRTQALEDEAKSRGHATHFLTNRMLFRQMYFQIRNENVDDFYNCLHQIKPHVLIVDVQGHIPDYMHEIARKFNVKIVILNGVGRVDENHADLVIVQGFNNGNQNKNTVSGPEYVILRSKLNQVPAMHSGNAWFVWGGANDKMSLLEAFNQFDDREAILAVHKEFINPSTYNKIVNTQPNSLHLICQVTGDAMLPIMANSKRACIAMGMTAWELAYFGTPTYVFSDSLL